MPDSRPHIVCGRLFLFLEVSTIFRKPNDNIVGGFVRSRQTCQRLAERFAGTHGLLNLFFVGEVVTTKLHCFSLYRVQFVHDF